MRKKHLRSLFMAVVLTVIAWSVSAQSDVQISYDQAADLVYRQEYLEAATAFNKVQEMLHTDNDHELYMPSIEAEGNCYYMLNFVSALRQTVNKAKNHYDLYAATLDDPTRWRWQITLNKLEGLYQFCMSEVEPKAFGLSEDAFLRCLQYIDSLESFTSDNTAVLDDDQLRISIQRELLSLYYKQRQFDNALKEAEEINDYYFNLGYQNNTVIPRMQQFNRDYIDANTSYAIVLARCHRYDEALDNLSFLHPYSSKYPSILRTKGKILMLQYESNGVDMRDQAMACYKEYLQLKKQELNTQLSSMSEVQREQYWLNMHDFLYDCCRMADYAPDVIYDLVLYCKAYLLEYNRPNAKTCTWKDVQRHLKPGECAVEFVQYYGRNDTKQLAALVVTKRCPKPIFVNIADVDRLINYRLINGLTLGEALKSSYGPDKNPIYNNTDLPYLIWTTPLLEAMEGAEKIYFAADGILHQLAIEYMMPDDTRSCRRLTTTRRVMDNSKTLGSQKMLLIGGINYMSPTVDQGSNNDAYAYRFLKLLNPYFKYLPGTLNEIESIYTYRQNNQDLKIEGENATDSAFRLLANHYPIVHVATHGYFCGTVEDGTSLKAMLSDNSMSESGLVFSGAQYNLIDSSHNLAVSDGLLSAKEMAKIPLDSVELMVLSACQTGLGYITADGVYGVQRALKLAGVKTMIVSLWSVDDGATMALMTNFYRNLKNNGNEDVYEAFMKARQQLMTEEKGFVFDSGSLSHKETYKYSVPQYSNAFILIDIK